MQLTCPECKNDVDLSAYPGVEVNHTIECGMCGISLLITSMTDTEVKAEIADEGK